VRCFEWRTLWSGDTMAAVLVNGPRFSVESDLCSVPWDSVRSWFLF
jgi:hypothetical protein